jgi:hypothetical protein
MGETDSGVESCDLLLKFVPGRLIGFAVDFLLLRINEEERT